MASHAAYFLLVASRCWGQPHGYIDMMFMGILMSPADEIWMRLG